MRPEELHSGESYEGPWGEQGCADISCCPGCAGHCGSLGGRQQTKQMKRHAPGRRGGRWGRRQEGRGHAGCGKDGSCSFPRVVGKGLLRRKWPLSIDVRAEASEWTREGVPGRGPAGAEASRPDWKSREAVAAGAGEGGAGEAAKGLGGRGRTWAFTASEVGAIGQLGRCRSRCGLHCQGPTLAAGLRPGHPGTSPRQQVGARTEGSRRGEEGRPAEHRPGPAHGDGQVASVSFPLVTTALHLFFSFSMNDLFSGL